MLRAPTPKDQKYMPKRATLKKATQALVFHYGHLFQQYLRQRKQRKESGYFLREFGLDINYWSRFVEWPLKFLFTEILDFFNIWVFVRTSSNFAHLASSQAIEFVDSGQTSENKSFLHKTQHSVIVVPEEQAHDLILFPCFHAFR